MVAGGARGMAVGPLQIIRIEFKPSVGGDDVPEVQLDALRMDPVDDALQFGAIFGFDMGPEDMLGGGAEEGQSFESWVSDSLMALLGIENFGREQVIRADSRYRKASLRDARKSIRSAGICGTLS